MFPAGRLHAEHADLMPLVVAAATASVAAVGIASVVAGEVVVAVAAAAFVLPVANNISA